MSYASDLRATADAYADDIETADEIATNYLGAPDAIPLPSTMINGLAAIDAEAMRAQMQALLSVKPAYQPISTGDPEFTKLMDAWAGEGSNAFGDRWTRLAGFVQGDSSTAENVSVISRLSLHAKLAIGEDGVSGLVGAIEAAQVRCREYLQNELNGLRSIWEDIALAVASGAGGAATGAGAGAAIGTSIFPGIGTAAGGQWGACIGGVFGLIGGIIYDFSAHAAEKKEVKQGVAGMAGLDGSLRLDTSQIGRLSFDTGSSTTTDVFGPWRPE